MLVWTRQSNRDYWKESILKMLLGVLIKFSLNIIAIKANDRKYSGNSKELIQWLTKLHWQNSSG